MSGFEFEQNVQTGLFKSKKTWIVGSNKMFSIERYPPHFTIFGHWASDLPVTFKFDRRFDK